MFISILLVLFLGLYTQMTKVDRMLSHLIWCCVLTTVSIYAKGSTSLIQVQELIVH